MNYNKQIIDAIVFFNKNAYSIFYNKLLDTYFLLEGENSFIPLKEEGIVTVSNARDITDIITQKGGVGIQDTTNIESIMQHVRNTTQPITMQLPFGSFGAVFHPNQYY